MRRTTGDHDKSAPPLQPRRGRQAEVLAGLRVRAERAEHEARVHSQGEAELKRRLATLQHTLVRRERRQSALAEASRTLRMINASNRIVIHAQDEKKLLADICEAAVEIGGFKLAWVGYARDDPEKSVDPVALAGPHADYVARTRVSWSAASEHGRGPIGTAIRTGKATVCDDVEHDPGLAPWRAWATASGFGSIAAIPLRMNSHVGGALAIYSGSPGAFHRDELSLLTDFAANLAYGIGALRARAARDSALEQLRQSMEAIIESLVSTMEMRDPYTAGHQQRVAELAVAIARELKLPENQIEGLHLAAMIHDVGKIVIPTEFLTRPGKLTDLEFRLIKQHVTSGYEVVKGVDFPWPIGETIRQHHERPDGTGYPRGLKGPEILLEARILSVADVVESMMSDRPYRPARGLEAALDEIRDGSGSRYDQDAVTACLRLFEEKRIAAS